MKSMAIWGAICGIVWLMAAAPAPAHAAAPAAAEPAVAFAATPTTATGVLHAADPAPGPSDHTRQAGPAAKAPAAAAQAPAGRDADPGLLLLTGMAVLLFMAGRRAP